jgi:hypothetical protein
MRRLQRLSRFLVLLDHCRFPLDPQRVPSFFWRCRDQERTERQQKRGGLVGRSEDVGARSSQRKASPPAGERAAAGIFSVAARALRSWCREPFGEGALSSRRGVGQTRWEAATGSELVVLPGRPGESAERDNPRASIAITSRIVSTAQEEKLKKPQPFHEGRAERYGTHFSLRDQPSIFGRSLVNRTASVLSFS